MQKKRYQGPAIANGISLPAELWAAIKARAEREDLPVSRIVRRAVIRELATNERKGQANGTQP